MMNLSTHREAPRPLDNDALYRMAPSIFATEPWHKMSDRYGFVPTVDVIEGMRREGLVPVSARQSRTRIEGKGDFTRHMVRFRSESTGALALNEVFPELVLVNSHDGSSAYEISAGMFRLACLNGMCVSAGTIDALKARHSRGVVGDVLDASFRVLDSMPKAIEQVQDWSATQLPVGAAGAFATAALQLRYDPSPDEKPAPINALQLLASRRFADSGNDIWSTFNRVQENLTRGGLSGNRDPQTGRRRGMRAITGISDDVRLNRALWTLAGELRKAVA